MRIRMASKSHPKNVVGKNAPPAKKKVAAPATVPVTVSETRIVTSFEFFVSLSASMRAMLVMTVAHRRVVGDDDVKYYCAGLSGWKVADEPHYFSLRVVVRKLFPSHLQIQDNMEYGL